MMTLHQLFSSPSPSLREKGLGDEGETHNQCIAKPSPPGPLSLYQGRGGEVNLLYQERGGEVILKWYCSPRRRRNGITLIIMVLVLGGLAIALLTLSGQTSIQMKSIRNVSLDNQQCSELIALGEKVLAARLLTNPEFTKETIPLDLPTTSLPENALRTQIGIVELTKTASADSRYRWTIDASFGAADGLSKRASKTFYLNKAMK